MKYKLMAAICCIVILCVLTGCQLAQENAETNAYEDRLVGVFATTEYLDLLDFESYLNDNLKGFSSGEIVLEGDTEKYQGRIYATLTTRTLTNDETSEMVETEEYVFEGIEGVPYFSATVPASAVHDSYITTISAPAISDEKKNLYYGDETNSTTIEGTIYISLESKERKYFFNPVYQSADGSVYLTSGSGVMVDYPVTSEGELYSQTLEAAYLVTENGKTKTDSISVKLSISVMFEPEKIVVVQMDADSRLISQMVYTPGELPETFVPEPDAAYLVVETHKRDSAGELTIARDLYGEDAETIETFFARADGVCIKCFTQIKWSE